MSFLADPQNTANHQRFRWLASSCWSAIWAVCVWSLGVSLLVFSSGCGTTKSSLATEQLLLSDAVDRSVAAIDFRCMSGRTVFLDTRYIEPPKERPALNMQQWNFVNAPYAISAIRQQVLAAGCRLVDKVEDAEIVLEPRIGTMASDAHQAVFGIPAANNISSAAQLVPNTPTLPSIPELALARRETQDAAAKIAIFAYDRLSREPVWQSGLSLAQSTARDTWIFGIGPIHRSAVREGNRLVSGKLELDKVRHIAEGEPVDRPSIDYDAATLFDDGWPIGYGPPKREHMTNSEPAKTNDPAEAVKRAGEEQPPMAPVPWFVPAIQIQHTGTD